MGFEWFICRRYLKAKRGQGFISLISLISVAGVMVGVMALIVVLAVMTGFTSEFRDKIIGINSHVVVRKLASPISDYDGLLTKIRAVDDVVGATPYLFGQVMVSSGGRGSGAILRGMDPESAATVLDLEKYLVAGSLIDLDNNTERLPPGLIIGTDLAGQLRVSIGDRVKLISANGPLSPMGVLPRIKACRIVGLFETGMYEYDSSLIYTSLTTAQSFLGLDDVVHGIEVRVRDIYRADKVAEEIMDLLGNGFIAQDWMRMNKNIFSALALEKTALSVIMTLVVLVAAFNIVSTLIMVVMEKGKDIAILKSMGATSSHIMRIFIYEGLVIGIVGTVLGVAGGLSLCSILERYRFIKLPDVYPVSTLPVKVLPADVLMISLAAIVITFAATIYPAWQASRVDPAVALRYE